MAGPQAKGHLFGSKNLGNTGAEIDAAVEMVRKIAEGTESRWSDEGMDFLEIPKRKGW